MTRPTASGSSLMPARESVERARRQLYEQLLDGASGAELLDRLTQFVDGVLVDDFRAAVRGVEETAEAAVGPHCCLVALGGYGRRELAPYSDVDLMLLYRPGIGASVEGLSRRIVQDVWDLGFKLGHSVRTIGECIELAATDVTVRTSMMEARFLAGSAPLFQAFARRFLHRVVLGSGDAFLKSKLAERQREYEKFGQTVYLLEPNVKKSKGGLRDLHLLQWAGIARFQVQTIQDLVNRGLLSRSDYLALTDARDFLWRIRAHLHLQAGMAQEILTFEEQVRLAAVFGFEDHPHLLAVEQFMRQYYRHTGALHEIAMRFVERCRRGSWRERLARLWPAPRIEGHFVAFGQTLTVPVQRRRHVLDQPALLLRLFALAQGRALRIDTELLEEIHRQVDLLPESAFRTSEVHSTFLEILGSPRGVGETLEAMHRAHLLEKLIPVFAEVRGLMQFNQYHKYTVDEHSLLAVGEAERLGQEPGLLREVYQDIQRKDLLHLAILLHDLGKGRELDHSEVGKVLAEDTATRLGLDEQERRTLVFLVHRHLLMAHTAFRRDPYDEKVVMTFSRTVGTPDMLRKLLILTAADIAAVGPGMLTKWKESLLVELYLQTHAQLTGDRQHVTLPGEPTRLAREVLAALADAPEGHWDLASVEAQVTLFPLRYLSGTSPARIAAHLQALRALPESAVHVDHCFHQELGTSEYTVLTTNDLTPGLFSKIAGVMAAQGLQILDAQIITRDDGIVVDTFQVADPDYAGAPPNERRDSLARTIRAVLTGEERIESLMAGSRRFPTARPFPHARQPTEVQVDIETSDRFTILEIFAHDQQGLLYVITRTMFHLGLSVHGARVSTRLDQVADVFYVTDLNGVRPEARARLEDICETIRQAIDRFLQGGLEEGSCCESSALSRGAYVSGDVSKGGSA